MPRFKLHDEDNPGGWSDWITPIMRGYKMACCDCGLVHEVEFNAIEIHKRNRSTFEYGALNRSRYRIEMRVRRNNRATANMRRKPKK